MRQDLKALLIKYGVCFGVASAVALIVFSINGFFTDRPDVNLQILSDGFITSGLLMLLFAGLMYVSGEGALLGIGYIGQCVVQAFVPMGRKNHESYAAYRERKIGKVKKSGDNCILVVGLIFFLTGLIFTVIFYNKYYK